MLAKQVDFNQVTQFSVSFIQSSKKRLRYLNRSLKYWLNKILSQLLWRLIGKRQINRGILSNFCCLLMTQFYHFSFFFVNFLLRNSKKLKKGQGHLPGLSRNIGVFCPYKLKIWDQAVQGSSMYCMSTYTWSPKFSRFDTKTQTI